jgi:hypothetical protein
MEIHWKEMSGAILIVFPRKEVNVALQVLKGLNNVFKLSFIKEAIDDIEASLRPKLTLVSHFHYCQKCTCEIDDRVGDNFLHMITEKDDKWIHRSCPPLKEVRPE